MSAHATILKANPDTEVRTTVAMPEDVWLAAKLLAQRRKCTRDEVVVEGMRMLFASLEGGAK